MELARAGEWVHISVAQQALDKERSLGIATKLVDPALRWHVVGCFKRYGAISDELCECEKCLQPDNVVLAGCEYLSGMPDAPLPTDDASEVPAETHYTTIETSPFTLCGRVCMDNDAPACVDREAVTCRECSERMGRNSAELLQLRATFGN
jgi:hypothetical protein